MWKYTILLCNVARYVAVPDEGCNFNKAYLFQWYVILYSSYDMDCSYPIPRRVVLFFSLKGMLHDCLLNSSVHVLASLFFRSIFGLQNTSLSFVVCLVDLIH